MLFNSLLFLVFELLLLKNSLSIRITFFLYVVFSSHNHGRIWRFIVKKYTHTYWTELCNGSWNEIVKINKQKYRKNRNNCKIECFFYFLLNNKLHLYWEKYNRILPLWKRKMSINFSFHTTLFVSVSTWTVVEQFSGFSCGISASLWASFVWVVHRAKARDSHFR